MEFNASVLLVSLEDVVRLTSTSVLPNLVTTERLVLTYLRVTDVSARQVTQA